jgi:hypothetical protein
MRLRLALTLSLLTAFAAASPHPARAATAAQCTVGEARACVLLIEVDGLEPEDVSQTATPFLWALAHPDQADPTGDPQSAPSLALAGRHGYLWGAARGVMQAGTAPATAALLTGAEPLAAGVPADEYIVDGGGRVWLEGGQTPTTSGTQSLLGMVGGDPERTIATFIGSPFVERIVEGELDGAERAASWAPSAPSPDGPAGNGSDPALCPLPRSAPGPDDPPPVCPARDAVTLAQAYQSLSGLPGAGPQLTYVHLAELGAVKRLSGAPEAVASALTSLDAALSAFTAAYANASATSELWQSTVVLVTGNHGYEAAPPQNRVPYPGGDATQDLADYVHDTTGGVATLVPQGTIGTVYWQQPPAADKVADLAQKIEAVRQSCGCIEKVLATRQVEDPPAGYPEWVGENHASWGLAAADDRPAGELLVVAAPEWALGKVVGDPTGAVGSDLGTNPYLASAGGPRNRAIAALVDGPAELVRQVQGDYAGVPPSPESVPDTSCVDRTPNPAADLEALAAANATPGDDADQPGYACQAETIDFAPSIAALLHLEVPADQIGERVRLLGEAFSEPLVPVTEAEEVTPPEDDYQPPLPPPPPPEAYELDPIEPEPQPAPLEEPPVPAPAPAADPFTFDGLVRSLRARVIDAAGDTWAQAPPGAQMTTIEVAGDFGRPSSAVTLTFYSDKPAPKARRSRARRGARRAARRGARRSARKVTLRTLAKFKPFAVKRGAARLKLRVPPKFTPTHIGVTVRELRDGGPSGPLAGNVVAISGARHLHRIRREFASARGAVR